MFYTFYEYIKDRYWDTLHMLSPLDREAMIFRLTCEQIPISLEEEDLIPGRYGCPDGAPYQVAQQRRFSRTDAYSPELAKVRDVLAETYRCITRFHKAHTCIDYEYILQHGLRGYMEQILHTLEKDIPQAHKHCLQAMLTTITSVQLYCQRFANLAQQQQNRHDPRLIRIREAMERVPFEPAEDFYQAVCAIWTMHSLVPISDNSWASVSLGRLDQYLYPFYEKDLSRGESREHLKAYLVALFQLLNTYGDGACALNIGGADSRKKDQFNDLSALLLEVEKELALPSPIIAVRMHNGSSQALWDTLIDKRLFSVGQPSFYSQENCRNAIARRGVPQEEAAAFSVNSCMGLHMAGQEIASMWGCMYNMHLPLELAITGGQPLHGQLPLALQTAGRIPENTQQLLTQYEAYLGEILDLLIDFTQKNAQNIAENEPNPFLSMLTQGCIQQGLDRALGATYRTETVETMGLVNTANAICAIEELVFRQGKYTLSQLSEAARQDYVGFEDIRADICRCEKFGTHSKRADEIAQALCHMADRHCRRNNRGNVYFIPSLHTLDSNVSFGNRLYTTLDGRLKGQPVSKNAGPTNDVRCSDPTGVILSAAALPQENFSGGQPIDLYFDPALLESKASRDKIKALIQTYFQLGGLQVQVNSVDIGLLERAYEKPEDYPMVVVRIGGYSRRFTELSKKSQLEFIQRFRQESC